MYVRASQKTGRNAHPTVVYLSRYLVDKPEIGGILSSPLIRNAVTVWVVCVHNLQAPCNESQGTSNRYSSLRCIWAIGTVVANTLAPTFS